MELRKIFIDNLKKIRKEKKFSQMKIAELCETSTSYIGEIEIGKKFPSVEMIEKLANALNIKAYEFFMENYSRVDTATVKITATPVINDTAQNNDDFFSRLRADEPSEFLSPKEQRFAKEIAREIAKELINSNLKPYK